MYDREKIMCEFSKAMHKLENQIKHRKLYNARNFVVRTLLKSGIALDFALPFMLASLILCQRQKFTENRPLFIDNIMVEKAIKTIVTSSGIELEKVADEHENYRNTLEYTTAWNVNDNGLYERSVISYQTNKKITLHNTEKLLTMTKEELEEKFSITNITTICKNELSDQDFIYKEAAVIATLYDTAEDMYMVRKETALENIGNSFWFLFQAFILGSGAAMLKQKIFKTYVKDSLNSQIVSFHSISKADLISMRRTLTIKKQNEAMLNDLANSNEKTVPYQYTLRRKK